MPKRSLKRNTFYSGVTNFSDMLLFALMILAGRYLGAENFGVFAFAQSITIVFLTFSNFGLNTLAVRDVARDRELALRYLGNIFSWKAILSFISYGSLILTIFYIQESTSDARIVVSLMGIAVTIRFFTMTGRCFLHAFERFDAETLIVFVEQVLLFGIGAFLLISGHGVIALAFAFLAARLGGFLFSIFILKKIIGFSLQFDRRFILDLQIKAIPIGIALFVAEAYRQVSTLILSHFQTFTEVGMYSAAFKIYAGLFLFPSIISTVLFPRLSNSYIKDKKEHNSLLVYGILVLLLISLPISVGGIIFSKEIILIAFGEGYIKTTVTMQIFFAVVNITFQIWLLRLYLISIDRQKTLMSFNIFGLCTLIASNLMLIPKYGIVGAAAATGISEFLLFCGIWTYLLKKHFRFKSISELVSEVVSIISKRLGNHLC